MVGVTGRIISITYNRKDFKRPDILPKPSYKGTIPCFAIGAQITLPPLFL